MAAVMAARIIGCTTIIAADLHDSRLDPARELGATHTVNSRDNDLTDALIEDRCPVAVCGTVPATDSTQPAVARSPAVFLAATARRRMRWSGGRRHCRVDPQGHRAQR
jgi:aryl-alcohol dehydrogenase